MKKLLSLLLITLFFSCDSTAQKKRETAEASEKKIYPVQKSETEWRKELDDLEFYVMRQKGTERPGTNEYNKFYEKGTYVCAACGVPLYESEYKYDSGSGWPAFDRGITKNLELHEDRSLGVLRTEVVCANCGGHLGHVFEDGPRETTGMRHCINSASMDFIPSENE